MVENIEHIKTARSIFAPSLFHAWKNGRMTLPVRPSQSVYAQFKHIVGVPSTNQQEQIPINKLRLLDILIDRLTKLRSNPDSKTNAVTQKVTEENIEATIKNLQQELNRSTQAYKPSFTGQFNVETGLLFSLYA
jgi:hypothetical protein